MNAKNEAAKRSEQIKALNEYIAAKIKHLNKLTAFINSYTDPLENIVNDMAKLLRLIPSEKLTPEIKGKKDLPCIREGVASLLKDGKIIKDQDSRDLVELYKKFIDKMMTLRMKALKTEPKVPEAVYNKLKEYLDALMLPAKETPSKALGKPSTAQILRQMIADVSENSKNSLSVGSSQPGLGREDSNTSQPGRPEDFYAQNTETSAEGNEIPRKEGAPSEDQGIFVVQGTMPQSAGIQARKIDPSSQGQGELKEARVPQKLTAIKGNLSTKTGARTEDAAKNVMGLVREVTDSPISVGRKVEDSHLGKIQRIKIEPKKSEIKEINIETASGDIEDSSRGVVSIDESHLGGIERIERKVSEVIQVSLSEQIENLQLGQSDLVQAVEVLVSEIKEKQVNLKEPLTHKILGLLAKMFDPDTGAPIAGYTDQEVSLSRLLASLNRQDSLSNEPDATMPTAEQEMDEGPDPLKFEDDEFGDSGETERRESIPSQPGLQKQYSESQPGLPRQENLTSSKKDKSEIFKENLITLEKSLDKAIKEIEKIMLPHGEALAKMLRSLKYQYSRVKGLLEKPLDNSKIEEMGSIAHIIRYQFTNYNPEPKSQARRLSRRVSQSLGLRRQSADQEKRMSEIIQDFKGDGLANVDKIITDADEVVRNIPRAPKEKERSWVIDEAAERRITETPAKIALRRGLDIKEKIDSLDLYAPGNLSASLVKIADDLRYLEKSDTKPTNLVKLRKYFEEKVAKIYDKARYNGDTYSRVLATHQIKSLRQLMDTEMSEGGPGSNALSMIRNSILPELIKVAHPEFRQVLQDMQRQLAIIVPGHVMPAVVMSVVSQLENFMGMGVWGIKREMNEILAGKRDASKQCEDILNKYITLVSGDQFKSGSKKLNLLNSLEKIKTELNGKERTHLEVSRRLQQLLGDYVSNLEKVEKGRKISSLTLFKTSDVSEKIRDAFSKTDAGALESVEQRLKNSLEDQDEQKAKVQVQEQPGLSSPQKPRLWQK